MSDKSSMTCGTCYFWFAEEGTPYCLMKDLFTHTEADHECDEENMPGEYYYSNKKDNEQHEEN